ncbi:MAG: hypothetical protein U5K30_13665 [Acidimicrobiales bacterium]|nr:hypothetical protein [Acidimicrobiales bacterium]
MRRVRHRPIVPAESVRGYGPVFNAGLLHHDGRYHLFARAVRDGYRPGRAGGPRFVDYVSDIVVFTSDDGQHYEFAYVLARAGDHDVDCFEDPRIQRVSDAGGERLLMTYTNLPAPERESPWRIGAHHLVWDGNRFHLEPDGGHLLGPDGIPNKDAVVFTLADGRVALIHRIHPDMQLAVFDDLDHLIGADEHYWRTHLDALDEHTLIEAGARSLGIGAGAPPVRTDDGFLLFFHERRADGVYTMNVALLDEITGRVTSMLHEPVLVPELHWERVGDVDDVVFVQGAHLDGDRVYLTYGAADRCVGAATASVRQLLAALAEPEHMVA